MVTSEDFKKRLQNKEKQEGIDEIAEKELALILEYRRDLIREIKEATKDRVRPWMPNHNVPCSHCGEMKREPLDITEIIRDAFRKGLAVGTGLRK